MYLTSGEVIALSEYQDSANIIPSDRLIIVSNAEPYRHVHDGNTILQEKLPGGLTTGLDPMMRGTNNVWIAWGRGDADFEVTDEQSQITVPNEDDGYILRRLALSEEEKNGFYFGFANETLWPICHSFSSRASFDRDHWEIYRRVNRRYADAVLDILQPEDRVWVHDYQLALVPRMIREARPKARIGLFWHIPWPSWEAVGILPWREEIIKGLLGADFVGFHTPWLVHNFFDSVNKIGGTVNTYKSVASTGDHKATVRAIPLGVDVSFFKPTQAQKEKASQLIESFNTERLILSVDRLDYTKGIDKRIDAISLFFEEHPEYRGRVTFIQRISPSRGEVPEYQRMRRDIERRVGQVNGEFQREEWMPIRYFYQYLPQQDLIPYYLAADVALITPLIDGMNLVAKEYVATRDNGTLILSEFAGAADTLTEAIQVNPYDTENVVKALLRALENPEAKQKKEFVRMKKKLCQMDVHWWCDRFLDEWELSLHSRLPS
ncbi:MAG: trehalose-6-phosphate synthase [Candidatus Bipolaricaulota bacterium]|nr:trehalose-6-phosphate synthase [Candidatus Bipolaricaulota bacterium]